jgi:hypothetical protein
METLGTPNTV